MTLENWSGEAWLSIRDLEGRLQQRMHHPHFVNSVDVSASGEHFLTAGRDGRIWDRDGELVTTLRHGSWIRAAAFSTDPEGRYVLTGGVDGRAVLWTREGERVADLSAHGATVHDVCFAPEGDMLATASADHTAILWSWDEVTGDVGRTATLRGHTGAVTGIEFVPGTDRLLTSSGFLRPDPDGTVRLWTRSGEKVARLGAGLQFDFARASPAGRIVTVASGGRLRVWDDEGNLLASGRNGSSSPLYAPRFSRDGRRMVMGASDGSVWVFDESAEVVARLLGHDDEVIAASLSPDGRSVLSCSNDKSARLWDLEPAVGQFLRGHGTAVYQVAFSPDGTRIATVSEDRTARLWSADGESLAVLGPHEQYLQAVEFSPDGRQVITSGNSGIARIWDLNGNEVARFEHQDWVLSADFSPDGRRIVTATRENGGSVSIWRVDDPTAPEVTFPTGASNPWSIRFTGAGDRVLVATTYDARTYDLEGRIVGTIGMHSAPIHDARLSPDQALVLTAAQSSAFLWNVDDGTLRCELVGHTAKVWAACFTPDGQRVVTASDDHSARLWDLDGELVGILRGHSGGVRGVAVSPDGRRVATASWDGTVRLWRTDPDELLRIADARINRDFTADELADHGALLGLPVREAQARVQALQEELVLRERVVARLHAAEDIKPLVRETTLRLAASLEDLSARDYNQNAWRIASTPGLTLGEYANAVRQARAACALHPEDANMKNTLGVALYRAERFEEAITTLNHSLEMGRQLENYEPAYDHAFLALSHAALGDVEAARRHLAEIPEPSAELAPGLAPFLAEARAALRGR